MSEDSAQPRLLIVEDNPSVGTTLCKILQKAGYAGRLAASGMEAVRLAEEDGQNGKVLNAALVDLRLPDMTGLDVLRKIRAIHPDTSIVMMTGHADTTSAVTALNEGAFAFLQKPCGIDDVKAILSRAVERQRLISENRSLLRQLQSANVDLEDKINVRTQELRLANLTLASTIEELKKVNAVKSEFVSMVSHELRTPLTIIIGFVDTLLKQKGKVTEERLLHYLGIIRSDATRLGRLIEDILNISNIQDKKLVLNNSRFDPKTEIAGIVDEFKVLNASLRFELTVDPAVGEIVLDKDRFTQVFLNIIGNAVKYSPPGGVVRVDIRSKGENLLFGVEDHGPGVPDGEKEKIFEAFYRTQDSINMRSPGTGLGLTITRLIIDAFGGRVWVQDAEGHRGSRFLFTLPKKEVEGKSQ